MYDRYHGGVPSGRTAPERLPFIIALAVVWLIDPLCAFAQDLPAPVEPLPIVPPEVTAFVEATVDASAFAGRPEVAVVLELDVSAEGAVIDGRVVEGAGEPFDSAALSAARRFELRPARRGEEAIAARIRYRYVFTAPPPEPEPDPVPEIAPAPESPVEPAPEPAAELEFGATAVVTAPPREVTRHAMERRQVQRMAGAHGDPIAAVELMPGVVTTPTTSDGGLAVRGSHPRDTQVFLEGAPVLFLDHVGGYTSFFNGDLLESIDLFPSNYSARYGRALGAVITVDVRDPAERGVHGALDVNVIDASLRAEAAIEDGPSFAVAARRSHVDLFFDAIVPEDAGVDVAPTYLDYQAIAVFRPSDRDRLRLLVYGTKDELRFLFDDPAGDPAIRGEVGYGTEMHRAQLGWRRRLSDDAELDVELTAGTLAFAQAAGALLDVDLDGYELTGRAEVRVQVADPVRLLVGVDTYAFFVDWAYVGPPAPPNEGDPNPFSPSDPQVVAGGSDRVVRPAAYVEAQLTPANGLTVVPGVRVDHYGELRETRVDPRLSARWAIAGGTTLKGGVGLYSQPEFLGQHAEGYGNPDLDPERALHTSAGVEQRVAGLVEVGLEGYYKRLWDRIVAHPEGGSPPLINDGVGRIYGAELTARWVGDSRLAGYVSYSLSRSERRDRDGDWRLFDYDRTHALTIAAAYELGAGWDVGLTLRVASGNLYTPVVGGVYDADTDRYRPRFGAVGSARTEPSHRLDLRIQKTWRIGDGRVALYLDVLNATNHQAAEGVGYSYDLRHTQEVRGLPILPNLGLRGEL